MYMFIRNKGDSKKRNWSKTMFGLVVLCLLFASCEEDYVPGQIPSVSFDPGKPASISSFSPEGGRVGTRLLIYGENFGTDVAKIRVTIGGAQANVISSIGSVIYCTVGSKSDEGTVRVNILDADQTPVVTLTAAKKFSFESVWLVSTLLGSTNPDGTYTVSDGPWEDIGGIHGAQNMSFDPQNPNHLYFIRDGYPLRLIDFEKRSVTTLFPNNYMGFTRYNWITWTLSGDTMVIATNMGPNNPNAMHLTRARGFMDAYSFLPYYYPYSTSVATHPINGEMYYSHYIGQTYRWDWGAKEAKYMFNADEANWEYNIVIHPTGNYAYLVVLNRHYIMRSDYNWATKEFTTPYAVVGGRNLANYEDGVGGDARFSQPMQGVFVKNPEYAGRDDEYDFYVCDQLNHCIRKITPERVVSTFAGRGSTALDANPYGNVNGDLRLEARFNQPQGIVYDELRDCFYVGDMMNRCVRKIGLVE
jgi:hypothetical protein